MPGFARFLDWDFEFIRMNQPDPHIEGALERVQAGKVDDYVIVVRAYHLRLRNFLVASCPPGTDADEIAHRAFIEAYRQIQHYKLGTNFYGWLSVIARNLLLAELKRYQRHQKNSASYLEHTLAQGLAETVESKPEIVEEKVAALQSCQEQLTLESQSLLRARYDSQTPLDQVALKIGKSVAAVKFQLFAIRKRLLKCVRSKLAAGARTEE
jgi:RNA polymerase sigma-70 factor (ECF subfamily)